MKHSRASTIAQAWMSRLFALVTMRDDSQAMAVSAQVEAKGEDAHYGEPEVVEHTDHVELRLYGDVIPHLYAPWFLPGEAVSDVGFQRALDRVDSKAHVVVTINSLGGDVFAGTAIAGALSKRGAATHVTGIAASIASVILAAGKSASIGRGATVMVHKPWSYAGGNAPAMRAEADVLDKVEAAMLDIYVGKSGKKYTRKQWQAALAGPDGADGTWWTGPEAVSVGIANSYEQPEEQEDERLSLILARALLEQRRTAAALYCSTLPKHLSEAPASVSGESPKAPANGGPEAKQQTHTPVRRAGVSYLG
jgi:ATP-dependent protease ClpP protease subunit